MKRLVLLLIIFLVGCNALNTFFNRGGAGVNSRGGISTNPIVRGGTTASSNIRTSEMKDAYFDPLLSNGEQYGYSRFTIPVYVIEEKDILNIKVRKEPDLSVTTRVSETGEIRLPLLEEVKVTGLTLKEAAQYIQNRLKDGYLKNPIVTVEINTEQMLELSEKEVFVSGQVETPGPVTLAGKYITVFDAINKAGGLTNIAWPSRTKLIRIENGVKNVIKVNVKRIRKGERSLDIIVKPGDVIYVPETIF